MKRASSTKNCQSHVVLPSGYLHHKQQSKMLNQMDASKGDKHVFKSGARSLKSLDARKKQRDSQVRKSNSKLTENDNMVA